MHDGTAVGGTLDDWHAFASVLLLPSEPQLLQLLHLHYSGKRGVLGDETIIFTFGKYIQKYNIHDKR